MPLYRKEEFAAVIYIYEFMPFGPVWNDGSFLRNKKSWCWIYNHPTPTPASSPFPPTTPLAPYCTRRALLNMDGRWRDGRKREEDCSSDCGCLWHRFSHLRRCDIGINGIQQRGQMAAGSVCLECVRANDMCAAGEVQDSVPRESQSVDMHMSDWPGPLSCLKE